jgi:predicted transcriptional regulator
MSGVQSTVSRDEDSGQFSSGTRKRVFDAMPDGEPVIASEIAESINEPRTTVNYHLNKLADDGKVSKKKFHERRVVWLKTGEKAG